MFQCDLKWAQPISLGKTWPFRSIWQVSDLHRFLCAFCKVECSRPMKPQVGSPMHHASVLEPRLPASNSFRDANCPVALIHFKLARHQSRSLQKCSKVVWYLQVAWVPWLVQFGHSGVWLLNCLCTCGLRTHKTAGVTSSARIFESSGVCGAFSDQALPAYRHLNQTRPKESASRNQSDWASDVPHMTIRFSFWSLWDWFHVSPLGRLHSHVLGQEKIQAEKDREGHFNWLLTVLCQPSLDKFRME